MTLEGPERRRELRTLLGLTHAEWVLAAGALSLSAAAHRLPARHRFPANLVIAVVASRWAARHGAGARAQGMRPRDVPAGIAYGTGASSLIALTMALGLALERARGLYQADHVVTASLPKAAFEVFLRIPLGTAFAEEVVFRGALLGLLMQRCSPRDAALICSATFGLWHVVPAWHRVEANPITRGRALPMKAGWVLASVASTAASGLMLAWLRLRSRSIVAPWLAHFAANAAGYSAAWLASRARPPVRPGPVRR